MKNLFDTISFVLSKNITKTYSSSFNIGVNSLHKNIQQDIHNIYGFVRIADEIVDSFHEYNKEELLSEFKIETHKSIARGISTNPILQAFQYTVNKYDIDLNLIDTFLKSMEMDLKPVEYTKENYKEYIVGSAEVVGLMCLKVFVNGDKDKYESLKPFAMLLGSAFQKINFLRDFEADVLGLGRTYFPNINFNQFNEEQKQGLISEIEKEFKEAYLGIKKLPRSSKLGVYIAYVYYYQLLLKIKNTPVVQLKQSRIRIANNHKLFLFLQSYIKYNLNLA